MLRVLLTKEHREGVRFLTMCGASKLAAVRHILTRGMLSRTHYGESLRNKIAALKVLGRWKKPCDET
jgi:hypothetical protein